MLKIFYNARSVRKYSKESISKDKILRIIEKAGQAPSGLNKQPWLYAVILDDDLREKIKEKCERIENNFYKKIGEKKKEFFEMNISVKKPFLTESSALIILFADTSAPYYKESAWLSVGWFILAAQEENLSTLTYTPEEMGFLNEMLNIPSDFHPEVILPLGSGEKKGKKARQNINDIVRIYE